MNIPHKPHPYGLLSYGLVQPLLRAPVLIDFEPRLPSSRPSGPDAFRLLVARNLSGQSHVYADSLFAATSQASELRRTNIKVTISFGDNGSADLRALKARAAPDLARGWSRTYNCAHGVVQVTGGDAHPTCVLSTFWRTPRPGVHLPSNRASYSIALGLYRCDADDADLAEFLHLDADAWAGRRLEMLEHAFEVNLATPPPGPTGLQLTKDNLKAMGKDRLLLLHHRTPGCSGRNGIKVDDLVKDILQHHPAAKTHASSAAWAAAGRSVEAVAAELLGPPLHSSPATSAYTSRYGLIDRMDRALYETFGTAYFDTWESCFVFSILFQQVINSHSLFEEYLLCQAPGSHGPHSPMGSKTKKDTFAGFVAAIISEQRS
jgi:hypothetical protein